MSLYVDRSEGGIGQVKKSLAAGCHAMLTDQGWWVGVGMGMEVGEVGWWWWWWWYVVSSEGGICHYNDVIIGRDSVSNHQSRECLLSRLIRRRSKKTSKLRFTGLCAGNSPGTGEFPAQRASNAENVSIWWRHHVVVSLGQGQSKGSVSWYIVLPEGCIGSGWLIQCKSSTV